MAKVLISFLGTGPDNKDKGRAERQYRPATYHIEDTDYKDTSFVAEAIASHYKVDKIILIGTTKSMWERVYEVFCTKQGIEINEEYWMELTSFCDNASHKTLLSDFPKKEKLEDAIGKGSKIIPIHYGLNEQELNANATYILGIENYLNKGEELIVDITHGFRSLPLYIMNLLVYLQNVSSKQVKISHILYGMLDITREIGYTPVIELSGLLEQNEWITGAYSFKEFGNSYKVSELLTQTPTSKSAASLLNSFSDTMNLNHMVGIRQQSQRLSSLDYTSMGTMANFIIPQVVSDFKKKFLANSSVSNALFQLRVTRWHFDHRNYSSAYMAFVETLITYYCEVQAEDWKDKNVRDNAKDALYKLANTKDKSVSSMHLVAKCFKRTNKERRNIAHAGDSGNNTKQMITNLENDIKLIETVILC